jgi:pimeloyl-ACP methyl ester carboxylesterase
MDGQSRIEPEVVRFEVGPALPPEITGGAPCWITARVFAPPEPPSGRASVLVCLHGGSYDWRYFHIEGEGLRDYSMAAHLAARGHVVIVPDQLGVGESARPAAPRKTTSAVAAAANHAAAVQAFARLADGELHSRLAPCADALKVGVGHSMGAMVLVAEQARHATYDLVAPLAYTNHGAHLQVDGKLVSIAEPLDPSIPDYRRVNRGLVARTFHWEDVAPEALAADEAMSVEFLSIMAWEAQHAPTAGDAASITAPVFLAYGERDVSPAPLAEPAFFPSSPDVTLFRLAATGHCQNFAPSRRRLWDRLDGWIRSIGGAPAPI